MTPVIDTPDGKVLFPYFVDDDMVVGYVMCFASFVPVEYVLDDDGKPTEEEKYTVEERARMFVTKQLDTIYTKWQKRQAANSAAIKSGGIS